MNRKHIAHQFNIRWSEPEDFQLEIPKEVDSENKPTETKTVPQPELWTERVE